MMRERQSRSLTSTVLFKTLDRFSSRSRPADAATPPLRRRQSGNVPSAPTHGRKIGGYEPPPDLPPRLPPRSRCLTPPPYEIGREEPVVFHDQIQSLLFKLPKEVLLMIYERVIGNQLLHIVRRRGKLGHTSCISVTGEPDACREAKCRGLKLPIGLYVLQGPGSGDIIQLLQSCRKVYVDATEVLYASNIFDFDSLESVVSLSCTILPQRFDSIQSVQLDFRFSLSYYFSESNPGNDTPRWLRTWAIIGSMKSLQNLWVRITWSRLRFSAIEEKDTMEPLWMATNLKIFEVSLPPPLEGKEVDWSDAPFQVTRRNS